MARAMGAAVRYGARCRQGDHRGGGGRFGVAKRPHRRRCLATNVVHVADVLVAHCLSPAADKREGGLGGRPAEGILILGVECGAVGKAAARSADGESAAGGAGDGLSIDGRGVAATVAARSSSATPIRLLPTAGKRLGGRRGTDRVARRAPVPAGDSGQTIVCLRLPNRSC